MSEQNQPQGVDARVYEGSPTEIGVQHTIDSITPLVTAAIQGGAPESKVAMMLSGCVGGLASIIVGTFGVEAAIDILRGTVSNLEANRDQLPASVSKTTH